MRDLAAQRHEGRGGGFSGKIGNAHHGAVHRAGMVCINLSGGRCGRGCQGCDSRPGMGMGSGHRHRHRRHGHLAHQLDPHVIVNQLNFGQVALTQDLRQFPDRRRVELQVLGHASSSCAIKPAMARIASA